MEVVYYTSYIITETTNGNDEPEYGTVSVLSMDHNSYVISPSQQAQHSATYNLTSDTFSDLSDPGHVTQDENGHWPQTGHATQDGVSENTRLLYADFKPGESSYQVPVCHDHSDSGQCSSEGCHNDEHTV